VYLEAGQLPSPRGRDIRHADEPKGVSTMQADNQDGLEPFDPLDNPADVAEDFDDDDRDDDSVDAAAPALDLLVGGGLDG
jgi:hypothetical protein